MVESKRIEGVAVARRSTETLAKLEAARERLNARREAEKARQARVDRAVADVLGLADQRAAIDAKAEGRIAPLRERIERIEAEAGRELEQADARAGQQVRVMQTDGRMSVPDIAAILTTSQNEVRRLLAAARESTNDSDGAGTASAGGGARGAEVDDDSADHPEDHGGKEAVAVVDERQGQANGPQDGEHGPAAAAVEIGGQPAVRGNTQQQPDEEPSYGGGEDAVDVGAIGDQRKQASGSHAEVGTDARRPDEGAEPRKQGIAAHGAEGSAAP